MISLLALSTCVASSILISDALMDGFIVINSYIVDIGKTMHTKPTNKYAL